MKLSVTNKSNDALEAAYDCPCGCHPAVTYVQGGPTVHEGCCCGNRFAVGIQAAREMEVPAGFQAQTDRFMSPWGHELEAAWAIGPSTHPVETSEASEN